MIEMNISEQALRYHTLNCILDEKTKAFESFKTEALSILWDIYRKEDEDLTQAKIRMFHNMEPAKGKLREHQLKSAHLLQEFDIFCTKNNIDYILICGTLLGAIRHGGFIPWDDDLDVSIMRDSLPRFIEAVTTSREYSLTIVYDTFVNCKQIRFWKTDFQGSQYPFIDIFPLDWASGNTEANHETVLMLRNEIKARIQESDKIPSDSYLSEKNEASFLCEKIFTEGLSKAADLGVISPSNIATSLLWSLDSYLTPNCFINLDRSSVFPLSMAMFEGHMYKVPAFSQDVLTSIYGNWLELPQDLLARAHFSELH